MQKSVWLCAIIFSVLNLSCSKSKVSPTMSATTKTTTTTTDTSFFKGADVSWVTQMEASGYKFYNANGTQQDLFALMKNLGFNSIRLRAWVNPTNGWCNTTDVVAKAIRAKNAGLNVMIDFHYSDTWADPGDQNKPAAWVNLSFANLVTTLSTYTIGVMDTLKMNGITPKWVQVGNETNDGMLWQDGRASVSMANFAALVSSGYNAVKSVSPSTQVIVHISNGYDNSLFEYIFDGLKANGAKWDIIGMSLYPTITNYTTLDAQCLSNMDDMVSRYGTPVMIVEVGIEEDQPTIAQAFLTDIIQKTRSVNNKQGLGVFYWEPESYSSWQGYTLGAFDSTGKPTVALNAFAN
jgi:arabinogalactan endo-1,4-beta-galactosidase